MHRKTQLILLALIGFVFLPSLQARSWRFVGRADGLKAEFIECRGSNVVLKGANGNQRTFPIAEFSPEDQVHIRQLAREAKQVPPPVVPGRAVKQRKDYEVKEEEGFIDTMVTLEGASELHVTGAGNPIMASGFNFVSPDAWMVFPKIRASVLAEQMLGQMKVYGAPAKLDENIRVVQYDYGSVVIPHGENFPALTAYSEPAFKGKTAALRAYLDSDDAELVEMKSGIRSLHLKRGYMATIAQNENGTGVSRNYVAQDHDLLIETLPVGLDNQVAFVRVFPWRWVNKKGVAGGIWQNLNLGWYYDWNINASSSLDLEYVPIRQNRWWPGLDQDWKMRGSTHLLGYNEPDRPDQANMSVDDAIRGWPDLLRTGLRVGAPAPSDGGLGWLYEFVDKADAAGLRVDFVPVHYYRAVNNPGDAKGAADQFYQFLKGIHDRVKRPLWVTEWNNGANWTSAPKPNASQQAKAIEKMIEMLDDTPFVERYSIYNWVEQVRHVQNDDGSLTAAGEVYRDKVSPNAYVQEKPGK